MNKNLNEAKSNFASNQSSSKNVAAEAPNNSGTATNLVTGEQGNRNSVNEINIEHVKYLVSSESRSRAQTGSMRSPDIAASGSLSNRRMRLKTANQRMPISHSGANVMQVALETPNQEKILSNLITISDSS